MVLYQIITVFFAVMRLCPVNGSEEFSLSEVKPLFSDVGMISVLAALWAYWSGWMVISVRSWPGWVSVSLWLSSVSSAVHYCFVSVHIGNKYALTWVSPWTFYTYNSSPNFFMRNTATVFVFVFCFNCPYLLAVWLVVAHKSLWICTSGTFFFFKKSILLDILFKVLSTWGIESLPLAFRSILECVGKMGNDFTFSRSQSMRQNKL